MSYTFKAIIFSLLISAFGASVSLRAETDQDTLQAITTYMKERQYDMAEALCKKQIRADRKDYIALTQLGEIYWEKGDRPGAAKFFKKAVKINPDYPYAHYLLGRTYIYDDNKEKGIEEITLFKEKMKSLPMTEDLRRSYISVLGHLTMLYFNIKDYGRAEAECREIIELAPDSQEAHYNLAFSYYIYRHNLQLAYNELQKVIEINGASYAGQRAKFFIDFIRNNPDPRYAADLSFIQGDR